MHAPEFAVIAKDNVEGIYPWLRLQSKLMDLMTDTFAPLSAILYTLWREIMAEKV